mmetsp:Transcript_1347/g.3439  ORF Transcript_1347/g.3439 Transcript_1347/m.3439 type:complete len:221 (+) Transcript_1347:453-1115(+)
MTMTTMTTFPTWPWPIAPAAPRSCTARRPLIRRRHRHRSWIHRRCYRCRYRFRCCRRYRLPPRPLRESPLVRGSGYRGRPRGSMPPLLAWLFPLAWPCFRRVSFACPSGGSVEATAGGGGVPLAATGGSRDNPRPRTQTRPLSTTTAATTDHHYHHHHCRSRCRLCTALREPTTAALGTGPRHTSIGPGCGPDPSSRGGLPPEKPSSRGPGLHPGWRRGR